MVNGARLGATGSSSKFCLQGQPGKVTVTLAWHDYPGSEIAAKALVNDLDLIVHADALGPLPLQGNGRADRLNNVEKVGPTQQTYGIVNEMFKQICWCRVRPHAGSRWPFLEMGGVCN